MCTTLFSYFWLPYRMLTTKNLVSITLQLIPFTHFALPLTLPLSYNHYSVLCSYAFVFLV